MKTTTKAAATPCYGEASAATGAGATVGTHDYWSSGGMRRGGNLLHVGKALDAALANDDPRVAELHVLYQSAAEVDKQLLGAGRQPAQRGGGGEGRKSRSYSAQPACPPPACTGGQ